MRPRPLPRRCCPPIGALRPRASALDLTGCLKRPGEGPKHCCSAHGNQQPELEAVTLSPGTKSASPAQLRADACFPMHGTLSPATPTTKRRYRSRRPPPRSDSAHRSRARHAAGRDPSAPEGITGASRGEASASDAGVRSLRDEVMFTGLARTLSWCFLCKPASEILTRQWAVPFGGLSGPAAEGLLVDVLSSRRSRGSARIGRVVLLVDRRGWRRCRSGRSQGRGCHRVRRYRP